MTDPNGHTPNTDQVKAAYRRALRNAFVASNSELEAEFDRWLARRDAEVAAKALEDAQEALVLKDAFTERSLRVIDEQIAALRASSPGALDASLTVTDPATDELTTNDPRGDHPPEDLDAGMCTQCGMYCTTPEHGSAENPEPTDSGYCEACGKTSPGHFTHCHKSNDSTNGATS